MPESVRTDVFGDAGLLRQFLDEMLDDEARRSLRVLPIGEDARYAISFGVRRQSYQWSAITDFIQVAREILAS